MARPWEIVERVETPDGRLELRRRAGDDVLLTIDGRILMSSRANRSEVALAQLACAEIASRPKPRILVGGLGMGYTLRAALDVLPATARVVVAEITPEIAHWCGSELCNLNGDALADPRVELRIEDVAATVRRDAAAGDGYDAILFDLYVGPSTNDQPRSHPLYGEVMLQNVRAALRFGGVFAVWAEQPCPPFAGRLRRLGFEVRAVRPGKGGLRHAVYLASVAGGPRAATYPAATGAVRRSSSAKSPRR